MPDLLLQAMSAKQNGDNTLAKQLLSQAIIQEPRNEAAWMLMSEVVEDIKLRRNCLERVLAINPDNTAASTALTKLNTSPLSPVSRGERDKPFNPPIIEKTPAYTPPFSWENEKDEFQALGDLTYANFLDEQPKQPAETPPTFDWANESSEPDKTIQKLFNAVSNPELATQQLPDTDLQALENANADGQTDLVAGLRGDMEDRWLDELVGAEEETTPTAPPQPVTTVEYTVSAEPQLGLDAFTSPEEPIEPVTSDIRLWDNPSAEKDRLVILSNKSIVYANPQPSDVPHILGLFNEKKMLRDLLGENAGMIKLDSIERLVINPKRSTLSISYMLDNKITTHPLTFSSPQVRDEVLTALQLRLGANFSESIRSFSLSDKIIPSLVILLFVVFIGWGLIAGLPMLSTLPPAQLGQLQTILTGLQGFVASVGIFNLVLILGFFGMLCLIWLGSNLLKPSKLVIIDKIFRDLNS